MIRRVKLLRINRIVLLKLLLLSVSQTKMNHFVRGDTSAPELEVDQSVYTNPYTSNNNISTSTQTPTPVPTDIQKKDEIAGVTDKNSIQTDTKVNKSVPPKSESSKLKWTYKEMGSIGVIDYLEEDVANKDAGATISVASHNIPKLPKKVVRKQPRKGPAFKGVGPKGIDDSEKLSCDEFSKHSRFNPYSVVKEKWFNFYRWDTDNAPMVIAFEIPTAMELEKIRAEMDKLVDHPINWTARIVIMTDLLYNASGLLVERGDHGEFWMYPLLKYTTDAERLEPFDVRFKQTGDNKYIAFIICEDDRAYVFSRMTEIPRKVEIPDAVAKIGWRGRDGRSYLYQGHRWMPIEEMDEADYWTPRKYRTEEHLPPPPEENDLDDNWHFGSSRRV